MHLKLVHFNFFIMRISSTFFCIVSLFFLFVSCGKDNVAIPSDPPKLFKFPFKIEKYKTELEGPIKVYVKDAHNVKREISGYNHKIVENEVFKNVGENLITSILFKSERLAEFEPRCYNDDMQIAKNGNSFSIVLTVGNNTSCTAIGYGDYDDIYLNCQAYCMHSQTGKRYVSDNFTDACFKNQALDCPNGDTIAILNYRIYLKKK